MAEQQIGHRKSSLVLSARFPVVKWRSRSDAKSALSCNDGKDMPKKRGARAKLLVC